MAEAILETERLRFRPYVLADQGAAFEMFADPDSRTFYPQMAEPANVREWIQWNLRNYEEYGFGLWALELKSSGEFIGDCGLTYQDVEGRRELEVGYHVVAGARRRGFATEAASATLGHGFRETAAASICSIVDPLNVASQAVAARIHTSKRQFIRNGKPRILYYTVRTAWLAGTAMRSKASNVPSNSRLQRTVRPLRGRPADEPQGR